MEFVIIIAGVVLSILTFVFRPTAMVARGGGWLILGAALIVATMMMLFFSLKDIGQPTPDDGAGAGDPSLDAIEKALSK